MSYAVSLVLLFFAAVLEAGGDALMRRGIYSPTTGGRFLFFLAGCVVLATYGCTVNAPRWDFGRLLGVYVAFFFVVAQLIAYFTFGQRPSTSVVVGGLLIVSGGLIVSLGQ
jgi:drug/metabolite transporter (DMT)-like permease